MEGSLTQHPFFQRVKALPQHEGDTRSRSTLSSTSNGSVLTYTHALNALSIIHPASSPNSAPPPTQSYTLFPAPPFEPTSMVLSPSESLLALWSSGGVVVVELSPTMLAAPLALSSPPEVASAHAVPVAETYLATHPGLAVVSVVWHPLLPGGLCVLTSDGRVLVYDVNASVRSPVLSLSTTPPDPTANAPPPPTTSLAFGAQTSPPDSAAPSWEPFTLYTACADGSVFALCPVLPPGSPLPASLVRSLYADTGAALQSQSSTLSPDAYAIRAQLKLRLSWLRSISGPMLDDPQSSSSPDSETWFSSLASDLLVSAPPLVQGPLFQIPSKASVSSLVSLAGSPPVLAVGAKDHSVSFFMLDEYLEPAWWATHDLVRSSSIGLPRSMSPSRATPQPSGMRGSVGGTGGGGWMDESTAAIDVLPPTSSFVAAVACSGKTKGEDGLFTIATFPSAPGRVFAWSTTGAYVLLVPWLHPLVSFCSDPSSGLPSPLPKTVTYELLSTAPMGPSSHANPVIGATVVSNPTLGYALYMLTANLHLYVEPLEGMVALPPSASSSASPKRATSGASSKAEQASLVNALPELSLGVSVPQIAIPEGEPTTFPAALNERTLLFFMGLARSIKEDSIEPFHLTHAAIRQRIKLLQSIQGSHGSQLTSALGAVDTLKENSKAIRVRLEEAVATQLNLSERLNVVLQFLNEWQPELSDAEKKHHALLKQLSETTAQFDRRFDVLSARAARLDSSQLGQLASTLTQLKSRTAQVANQIDRAVYTVPARHVDAVAAKLGRLAQEFAIVASPSSPVLHNAQAESPLVAALSLLASPSPDVAILSAKVEALVALETAPARRHTLRSLLSGLGHSLDPQTTHYLVAEIARLTPNVDTWQKQVRDLESALTAILDSLGQIAFKAKMSGTPRKDAARLTSTLSDLKLVSSVLKQVADSLSTLVHDTSSDAGPNDTPAVSSMQIAQVRSHLSDLDVISTLEAQVKRIHSKLQRFPTPVTPPSNTPIS